MSKRLVRRIMGVACATAALGAAVAASPAAAAEPPAESIPTRWPIKHLVVIVQGNRSFDHYFGTYPEAKNLPGETPFRAKGGTPTSNGLSTQLIQFNPNLDTPNRLPPSLAVTCSRLHDITSLQTALNQGLVDNFSEGTWDTSDLDTSYCPRSLGTAHYDGNTVTALWNWAQHYAISDNHFQGVIGSSAPNHLNLVAGNTSRATPTRVERDDGTPLVAEGTVINDAQSALDKCARISQTVQLSGRNVGDLLNAKRVTWGWFHGGFRPSSRLPNGDPVCETAHRTPAGFFAFDYIPHHAPFQYWPQTANPDHLPPSSVAAIGTSRDQANHLYDTADFYRALRANRVPAVSFIKNPAYTDEHGGYSSPLAGQRRLVTTINQIMRSPIWESSAIIIMYDEGGGYYDHAMPPILETSQIPGVDALTGEGQCGTSPPKFGAPGRCGPGQRTPLVVISPFAKENHVDHRFTESTSILRLIEDNWRLGRIGGGSFDARAASLVGAFDFAKRSPAPRVILNPGDGTVRRVVPTD